MSENEQMSRRSRKGMKLYGTSTSGFPFSVWQKRTWKIAMEFLRYLTVGRFAFSLRLSARSSFIDIFSSFIERGPALFQRDHL